ncbi:MAG TPA: HD domain-containing protein [Firmicutes bacterium]|mgnify:CR=1 FL=1|nr:HD domain-containing protein [Bacillota bacterium]
MRTIKTTNLVPGMVLGQDVLFPRTGATLVSAGTKLTFDLIRRIESFGIREVIIMQSGKTQQEAKEEELLPVFTEYHDRVITTANEIFTNSEQQPVQARVVKNLVSELLEQVELDSDLMLNLTHLKSYDDYLFSHCVNVSILSILIGEALGYPKEELNLIGTAALVHDLGMMKVPNKIWKKNGVLDAEEVNLIKNHPLYGVEMLKDFPEEILSIVKEHHEKYDGSGYPQGLKGEEIAFKARIVGLADVYDACISNRPYRPRLTPQQALQIIFQDKEKYDPHILKAFISVMAIYPIGSLVKLNTGEIAKVIRVNKNQPFRPVIKVLFDRNGNKLDEPLRINLDDDRNNVIHIKDNLSAEESNAIMQQLNEEPGVAEQL